MFITFLRQHAPRWNKLLTGWSNRQLQVIFLTVSEGLQNLKYCICKFSGFNLSTVEQLIFACRKFSRISRKSMDSRKFPAREYYLKKLGDLPYHWVFTEWESDNSKLSKYPFKVDSMSNVICLQRFDWLTRVICLWHFRQAVHSRWDALRLALESLHTFVTGKCKQSVTVCVLYTMSLWPWLCSLFLDISPLIIVRI